MATTKTLTVFCTEIAAMTGRHAYRPVDCALAQFLLHNESVIHNKYPFLVQKMTRIRQKTTAVKLEEYRSEKRHASVLESITAKMSRIENPDPAEAKLVLEGELASIIDPVERGAIRSVYFRSKGVQNESITLDAYEVITGVKITNRSTEFQTGPVKTTPAGHSYRVGGRLDALCEKLGRIVEVKSRMNRFFIPEYDRVQVYGYFAITNLKSCDFIQSLNGVIQSEIITFDDIFWATLEKDLEEAIDASLSTNTEVANM
jgi:hypothetical protein